MELSEKESFGYFIKGVLPRKLMDMQHVPNLSHLALRYHQRLPAEIRGKLNIAGFSDSILCRFRVGWDGNHVTIPIADHERRVTFFRLASLSGEASDRFEIRSSVGAYPEVFGWERLSFGREWVVVSDGEFDRLILEAYDIPSITSTDGPAAFLERWIRALYSARIVYLCFHNDESSIERAQQIAEFIPHGRIVTLPKEVGPGGTIHDYFQQLGMKRGDFMALLKSARLPGAWRPLIPPLP